MMKTFLLLNILIAAAAAVQNSGIYHDIPPRTLEQKSSAFDKGGSFIRARVPMNSIVHGRRETNAERFKRGDMRPLPPTKRKSALRPRASPAANCAAVANTVGRIQVSRASDNSVLGYIRDTFDSQQSYTYGKSATALTVSIPMDVQNNVPFEITAVNGPDAAHPFVGAVGASGGYNFNNGEVGYAYLSGTGHTPANSPPSSTAGNSVQTLGYNGPAESTVWKLNCATLDLTAQWTNDDGSQPSTSIFYDPPVDFLGLVGDFDKYTQTFPSEGAYLVTLKFAPNP